LRSRIEKIREFSREFHVDMLIMAGNPEAYCSDGPILFKISKGT
jgi:hypothetical protein